MTQIRPGEDPALIERFLEMLAAEAGASANTIAAYGTDLRLASQALDGGLALADRAAIERLAEEWRDLARATVARKSAALRRFYGFLVDEKLRADDPGSALPRPGNGRGLPRTLSNADVETIFEIGRAHV